MTVTLTVGPLPQVRASLMVAVEIVPACFLMVLRMKDTSLTFGMATLMYWWSFLNPLISSALICMTTPPLAEGANGVGRPPAP